MKICKNCGTENNDGNAFCTACGGNSFVHRCSKCGTEFTGNFCSNCGKPRPNASWTCSCGAVNEGNFCPNCGKPRA